MAHGKIIKAARVATRVEPELRSAIEREARVRDVKVGRIVRSMLRDQLAILMLNSDRSASA